MNEHIIIITGAAALSPRAVEQIPGDALLVAVDGGLDHALAAGLQPDEVVGDMDSVTDAGLAWAEDHALITRHPSDKNETDTELALALAVTRDPERITLIGGGDRLDHTIAALGALGAPHLTSVPVIDAWWGDQHVRVLHGPGSVTLRLVPGSTLTLLALHGPCANVTLNGVRWELDHFQLDPLVGVGVSNEALGRTDDADGCDGTDDAVVTASVSGGTLTIFDVPARAGRDSHPPTVKGPLT